MGREKYYRLFAICIIFLLVLAVSISAYAHSGKTDSSGGHRDSDTGEYHYHHGYPAHDHYDMDGDGIKDCPYNFNDKTDHSPGNNSGSSGISQNKNPSSNNDQPKDTFGDVVIEFFEFCFMFALCCVPIFLFSRYILERLLSLFLSEDRSFCISLAISVIIALMSLVLIV
jgi:hypothetical protein